MKVGRTPRSCNRTLADLVLSETGDFLRDRNVGLEVVFVKSNKDGHWYLRCDLADVTALLKELHRIVNEAIRTQTVGDDQAEGLTFEEVQPAS
jgi:(2Fe-2S) ferredoxin